MTRLPCKVLLSENLRQNTLSRKRLIWFDLITLVYRKKILKCPIDKNDCFLCFLGWRIRFWHPFLPIWSRFSCTGSGHFPFVIENRKIIFRKKLAIVLILIIFYVFLDAESDSGICFYPSRPDFAVLEVAIFQYIEEWPYSVQQNLDVMGKNGCQNRIQRPKKHRKWSKSRLWLIFSGK